MSPQYKMSHRLVFDELREEQALKTMGAVYERRAEFKEAAEFLAKTKAKDGQVIEFISKLIPAKNFGRTQAGRRPIA